MLFGCFYLLQFTSEEVTNLLIDDFNLMSFVLFFKPQNLELLSSNKESIKEFKNNSYINITIYIITLILIILSSQ